MKISFFHDNKMTQKQEGYYSTHFKYSVWRRYLKVFENLRVSTRIKKDDEGNMINLARSNGPNVEMSPIHSYKDLKSLVFDYRNVKKEILSNIYQSDAIIVRMPSTIGVVSLFLNRKVKKPVLVEVVGCIFDSYWYYGTFIPKLLSLPTYLIHRYYIKNADFVIYITKDFLQRRYPSKGKTYGAISNVTVDVDKFKSLRRKKVINPKNFKIGLIGSLNVNYKGHETAFRTVKALKERGYTPVLELVGGGEMKRWQKLINKLDINENVEYKGYLSAGKDVDNWMKTLDFYIQPSTSEGHGRAIVEAISNGCITFATNIGGIPDSVKNDFLIKKNDYKDLSRKIVEAINNSKYREKNIEENLKKIYSYKEDLVEEKRTKALNDFKNYIKLKKEGQV